MSDAMRRTGGWTADDAILADLRSWLVDQGFAVLDDRYDSEAFGNQIVIFARPIAIRLVRDRSEWGVDLLGPDGQWTWIGYWGGARTSEPLSAADQAGRLRALLQAEGAESTETTE
jgi:hypothetical protein